MAQDRGSNGSSSPGPGAGLPGQTLSAGEGGPRAPWRADEGGALLDLPVVPLTRYRVERELARGGLGRILLAHDTRLDRRVALKLLLKRTPRAEARFAREALVTLRLQHPAIVPVYEAGQWPDGEPFIAMRYVEGYSLKEALAVAGSLRVRLRLLPNLIAVAEAMAYAHGQGILHRDLKPSNVLVGDFGETVVIDWGLAKKLGDEEEESFGDSPYLLASRELTASGSVLGTPAYMSPEQARGEAVDARTDVHALGLLLRELLEGSARPLGVEAAGPPARRAFLAQGPLAELRAIAAKATAPEPSARYPTAREFLEELQRFSAGQQVAGYAYPWWWLLARGIWQWRQPLVAGAVALLLVLSAALGWRALRQQSLVRAQEGRLLLEKAENALPRAPTQALAYLKEIPPGSVSLDRLRKLATTAWQSRPARHVFPAGTNGHGYGAFSPDGAVYAHSGPDGQLYVWRVRDGAWLARLAIRDPKPPLPEGEPLRVGAVAFSPEGDTLAAVAYRGGEVTLWRWREGPLAVRTLNVGGEVVGLGFTEGGRWLLVMDEAEGALPRLVSLQGTHAPRALLGYVQSQAIGSALIRDRVRLDPLGRRVAYTAGLTVRVLDVDSGRLETLGGAGAQVTALDFSQDGTQLLAGDERGELLLWGLGKTSPPRTWQAHEGPVRVVAFSPDGRHVASSGEDWALFRWTLDASLHRDVISRTTPVRALAFSPSGVFLAFSFVADVRLWSTLAGKGGWLGSTFKDVVQLEFSPDGRTLAAVGREAATLWEVLPREAFRLEAGEERLHSWAFTPDGATLVTASSDGTLRRWMRQTSGTRGFGPVDGEGVEHVDANVRGLAVDAQGTVVAVTSQGAVHVWPRTGRPQQVLAASGAITAFVAAGPVFLFSNEEGAIQRGVASGERPSEMPRWPSGVSALALSPDGAAAAIGSRRGEVALWDEAEGRWRLLGKVDGAVKRLVFSPEGQRLAAGSAQGEVAVWTFPGGQGVRLGRLGGEIQGLAFAAQGAGGLAGDASGRLAWWGSLEGPNEPWTLFEGSALKALAVSRDGRIASLHEDGLVRVWGLQGVGSPEWVFPVRAEQMGFSPEGSYLVAPDADGTLAVWGSGAWAGPPAGWSALSAWMDSVSSVRIQQGHIETPLKQATAGEGRSGGTVGLGVEALAACGGPVVAVDRCLSGEAESTSRICPDGQLENRFIRMERRRYAGGGRWVRRLPSSEWEVGCGPVLQDPECDTTCDACVFEGPWIDRDLPTGSGDFEVSAAAALEAGCPGFAVALQCLTDNGLSWYQVGTQAQCDLNSGLTCSRTAQDDRTCLNYKIRVCCARP